MVGFIVKYSLLALQRYSITYSVSLSLSRHKHSSLETPWTPAWSELSYSGIHQAPAMFCWLSFYARRWLTTCKKQTCCDQPNTTDSITHRLPKRSCCSLYDSPPLPRVHHQSPVHECAGIANHLNEFGELSTQIRLFYYWVHLMPRLLRPTDLAGCWSPPHPQRRGVCV